MYSVFDAICHQKWHFVPDAKREKFGMQLFDFLLLLWCHY